jgi:AraC-like DNA-binding protein
MCELIGQQDGKKYPAKLDLMLKPINTDEEDNIGEILQTADLAPGQRIPDGNYTRLPYQFEPNEKRVRVERGRMLVGWLWQLQRMEKQTYTVKEIATIMSISRWTVVRLFQAEGGVIVLRGKQRKSLRIPRFVLERVIRRISVPSK